MTLQTASNGVNTAYLITEQTQIALIPPSSSAIVLSNNDTNSGGGVGVGLEEGAVERVRMHVGGCDRALQALMQVCIVYVCICMYVYVCMYV